LLGHSVVSQSFDVIIVGAGIVGAACAAECARGGLKVLVLDRGPIGGGTTAAGMGHIVVMDDSEAQFALTSYSRRLWHQFAPDLPADVEFDQCGTLWVAADEEEMREVYRKQKNYTARGIRVEVLDAAEVKKAEPNLRPGLAGGLRVVDDAVLYPPCAARFFLEQAKQHGAEVRTGVAVREMLSEGGAVLADGTRINAARSVNATGPWSPELTPGLPVRKRKGHLVITDRYRGYVHHQIVELGYLKSAHSVSQDSVAFNIQPRKTGQMLLGSSRQFGAEDTSVDPAILSRMIRRTIEYLPTIGSLSSIRVWTGHRAATPDKLPLIGPSLASDRIWLATGHEGLGITTSTGTGRLLADLLLGRPSEIPSVPYAPARLANGVTHHD
jgi:glycine/D-amino acid oxidase-like deaminating enzyme